MTREEQLNWLYRLKSDISYMDVVSLERIKLYRQVLSEVIKALEQEPTAKNDLGVDWESYKDADGNSLDDLILEVLQNNFDCGNTYGYKVADEIIGLLPPVTPQPKTGHWIANAPQYDMLNPQYICSECGNAHTRTTPYCEMCGAKMVEPQESEDK